MTIQEVHDHILLRLNKDQTGYVSHEEIDLALDFAQMSYFNRLFGSPTTYQPGRNVAMPSYGVTQKIHDDLLPFKRVLQFNRYNISAINSRGTGPFGVVVMPEDYLHMIALYCADDPALGLATTLPFIIAGAQTVNTTILKDRLVFVTMENTDGSAYDGAIAISYAGSALLPLGIQSPNTFQFVPSSSNGQFTINATKAGNLKVQTLARPGPWEVVEFLSEDQWAYRISSKLLEPSVTEPICKMLDVSGEVESLANGQPVLIPFASRRQVQLWPEIAYTLECVYLRRPAKPVFAYTLTNRQVTYDPNASVQSEWNDQALTVVMELAMNILAQNVQDQVLDRHTEIKNNQPR